jgi:hypothetical protein
MSPEDLKAMSEQPKVERKVSPVERLFSRSPHSIVTMVARIKGNVSPSMVRNAIPKVRQRHTNLRVRIKEDSDHIPWFTSQGAGEIPIGVVPRESDDHWIQVHQEASRIPFEFDVRPPIRFTLVQSPTVSELIILCHHIICDGLSLAYLARDLMVHLGDPTRPVEVLPDPVPIDRDNLPEDISLNPIVRFFINRINRRWERDKVLFDQEDYENLNEAYWANFEHQVFSVELSEAQTSALVDRCRRNGVTVNSALTMAFAGAQLVVQGDGSYHSGIGVAANVRDRLRKPVGQAMGFYAAMVTPKHKYNGEIGFWENARRFHKKVTPLFTNRNLFGDFISWCYLEPAILEAIHFKRLGGLVAPHQSRYQKLSAFGERDDVVLALLRRDRRESLDRTVMGTAVTNLARMDFPRTYGALELERLIMQPGGAFPLVNVNLVLGAVTCSGRLSLVVEYAEQAVDTETMGRVKDKAMEFLLDEQRNRRSYPCTSSR